MILVVLGLIHPSNMLQWGHDFSAVEMLRVWYVAESFLVSGLNLSMPIVLMALPMPFSRDIAADGPIAPAACMAALTTAIATPARRFCPQHPPMQSFAQQYSPSSGLFLRQPSGLY
jgi:hypothetical protein